MSCLIDSRKRSPAEDNKLIYNKNKNTGADRASKTVLCCMHTLDKFEDIFGQHGTNTPKHSSSKTHQSTAAKFSDHFFVGFPSRDHPKPTRSTAHCSAAYSINTYIHTYVHTYIHTYKQQSCSNSAIHSHTHTPNPLSSVPHTLLASAYRNPYPCPALFYHLPSEPMDRLLAPALRTRWRKLRPSPGVSPRVAWVFRPADAAGRPTCRLA